ncbi:MAG: class I SAM-dependent methyltransferase [Chloroflexi bacterium]|nr:MAG: class I SAM-dependent methyltransferase [Chloroflexota bacterium]
MSQFEDHFSQQSVDYAVYRPRYPAGLFAYLASLAPNRRLAWDCGTGNGQAAIDLAGHFEQVVATDASADQIAHAFAHERIEYRVGAAEQTDLEPNSVDLVTVAIAVHWFDLPRFYTTVRRVSVPNGILAVWTYYLPVIEPVVDAIVYQYYREVLAGFWPERWQYVDERYQTLPFPFPEMKTPAFEIQTEWNLDQLVGFLSSWSASQRFREARGQHPLSAIWPALTRSWGSPDQIRLIRWPLYLRVGLADQSEANQNG